MLLFFMTATSMALDGQILKAGASGGMFLWDKLMLILSE